MSGLILKYYIRHFDLEELIEDPELEGIRDDHHYGQPLHIFSSGVGDHFDQKFTITDPLMEFVFDDRGVLIDAFDQLRDPGRVPRGGLFRHGTSEL
jgi:hypothetical protein